MADKIKLAMVGCGGIGNWHLSRLKTYSDVEFVGFMDVIPERADAMVTATGQGKRYGDVAGMLDAGKPDALYICVPPAQHGHIEMAAIERGIHFLVQKPIGLDMGLAHKIETAAEKKNIITCVGFQDRYLDLVPYIQKFVAENEIGLVTGAWVGGIPGVDWWRKMDTSGGQVVEQNIHLFDYLRFFFGEAAEVSAFGRRGLVRIDDWLKGYDVHDCSSANVLMKNGIIVNMLTGDYLTDGGNVKCGMTFYAKDGTLDYVLRDRVVYKGAKGDYEVKTQKDQGEDLDRTFIEAVKSGDGSKIRSPYADAARTLALTLACNTSMETGKTVKL